MIDQIIQLESKEEIAKEIECFGRFLQCFPEELKVDCENKHYFAPGVYIREMLIPKGTFIIGKKHKTEHFNIVLSGKGRIISDGEIMEVKAGDIFVNKAGGRKVGIAEEDIRFLNIFPTKETDIEKLEEDISFSEPEPTKEEKMLFDRMMSGGMLWE